MKSFKNYLEERKVNALMAEVAHKMVEVNVDPWNFLMEYYKNEPDIALALEFNKEESLNEFWGGLKRMGQSLFKGAKQFGQGLGAAAQAVGGSAMDTAKQIRAGVAGPEAHYAASIEALQGLSKELNKNQAVQAGMESNPNIKKLVGDLQGILKQLEQQKQFVSDLITRQAGTTTAQTTPGTMGANPQAQVPGATAPGTKPAQAQPQSQPFKPSGTILGPTGQPITA